MLLSLIVVKVGICLLLILGTAELSFALYCLLQIRVKMRIGIEMIKPLIFYIFVKASKS